MAEEPFRKLLNFVDRCDRAKLPYDLDFIRPESLVVLVHIPGQYWEVEFFADHIEIERFYSSGEIDDDETLLDALLASWEGGDPEAVERVYPSNSKR